MRLWFSAVTGPISFEDLEGGCGGCVGRARSKAGQSNSSVTLDLHEIQATVLRYRPEPYYGTHIKMHIDDARSGREFLRRLAPHVASAADWWNATDAWIAVAISYTGLVALGVPEESLQSFPEAFRVGMAARADILLDRGENDPKNWDPPFGSGQIHIAISVFSDSEEKWRHTMALARQQYHGFSGVSVVDVQDFGAQPGDLNPLGYKDGIGQPAIEGSGVDPLPGQGRPIKAGEFILGYPGEAGVPLATLLAGCARAQRHLHWRTQVPIAGRSVQPIPARQCSNERRTRTAGSETGWPLAQRRAIDARAGQGRPRARPRPAAEQRLQLCQRSGRQAGAARLPHAAGEPTRYQDAGAHGREHPSHHPAQHDLRSTLRRERAFGAR